MLTFTETYLSVKTNANNILLLLLVIIIIIIVTVKIRGNILLVVIKKYEWN